MQTNAVMKTLHPGFLLRKK